MDDLISRWEAINALERKKDKNAKGDVGGFYNRIIQNDIDALMQLPSAQPETIRCKDCKWCEEHYDTDVNAPYWICKNWDSGTDADGFCHEAERRNE